jgi:hypothetical protein
MKTLTLTTLVGLGVMLASSVAWATLDTALFWQKSCQSSTSAITTNLAPGTFACWDPDTITDASPIIFIGGCKNLDVFVWDDKTGAGTDSTTTWLLEVCPTDASSLANDTVRDEACKTMQDTSAFGPNAGWSGAPTLPWVRVVGQNDGVIGNPRFIFQCN